ncbi:MAG: hypothetical protein RRY29_10175 [Desulfovibrionaceae bacterium]
MQSLLITFTVILSSLCAGYGLQRAHACGCLWPAGDLLLVRQRMQRFALFVCMPTSAMFSLWGLPSPSALYTLFPLFGIVGWLTGGLAGLAVARFLGLSRSQTGSVFCCATLTNIAGIGGLVCVLFLGEQSIALVALYRMCEEFYYFGIVCPVSRAFGTGQGGMNFSSALRHLVHDKVIGMILLTLSLGLGLNLAGIPRPAGCGFLASGIMIFATMMFLVAIGMSLRISHLGLYTRQCLGIICCKFLVVPAVIISLAWLCGLGHIDNGLPLKVMCILSAMPVAMNALVPPALFGLDVDLANTCWLGTTAALVVVVPLLLLVMNSLS